MASNEQLWEEVMHILERQGIRVYDPEAYGNGATSFHISVESSFLPNLLEVPEVYVRHFRNSVKDFGNELLRLHDRLSPGLMVKQQLLVNDSAWDLPLESMLDDAKAYCENLGYAAKQAGEKVMDLCRQNQSAR